MYQLVLLPILSIQPILLEILDGWLITSKVEAEAVMCAVVDILLFIEVSLQVLLVTTQLLMVQSMEQPLMKVNTFILLLIWTALSRLALHKSLNKLIMTMELPIVLNIKISLLWNVRHVQVDMYWKKPLWIFVIQLTNCKTVYSLLMKELVLNVPITSFCLMVLFI